MLVVFQCLCMVGMSVLGPDRALGLEMMITWFTLAEPVALQRSTQTTPLKIALR